MPEVKIVRYTINYKYQGNPHTAQFPASSKKSAKQIAKGFWDGMYDGHMKHSKGQEVPEFVSLTDQNGKKLKWKP